MKWWVHIDGDPKDEETLEEGIEITVTTHKPDKDGSISCGWFGLDKILIADINEDNIKEYKQAVKMAKVIARALNKERV